jgi:putative membrane protein
VADPRVFFAAERTLLAWIRTGLTVMGLGFVVARFGLFLSIMSASHVSARRVDTNTASTAIGIALVVLGTAAIAGAWRRHLVYVRTLPVEDVPLVRLPMFATFVAAALVIVGIFPAAYLMLT